MGEEALTKMRLAETVPQRLAILAAGVVSICLIAYPPPIQQSPHYRGDSRERRAEAQRLDEEARSRRYIFNRDMYPDYPRLAMEIAFVWLIAIGFAWAVKPGSVTTTR